MADDPRKALKQSITDILAKIQELELTVSDFNGDQELLQSRVNGLVQELEKLQALSSTLDYRLPKELLGFLDKGGNPDSYTAEVFARANRANQFSKGKVDALHTFRESLKQEVEAAYPAEAAAYASLSKDIAAEDPKP